MLDTYNNLIAADMHCHTLVSVHAYHTLGEMIERAKKIGLKAFAVTDHGPAMQDAPLCCHFEGLHTLPDYMEGIRVYKGVEANILDFNGNLDIPDPVLENLEWVIASFHEAVCPHSTFEQHTEAYLKLAENPHVKVIGHSAGDYLYDYKKVLPVFKKNGILVEINKNQADLPKCKELALLCKQYEIPVVVDSDAHNIYTLCDVSKAMDMLNSIKFPDELIINKDLDRLEQWIFNHKSATGHSAEI